MFIVTDAFGYIGSEFISYLNQQAYYDIVGFDEEENLNQKQNNLIVKEYKSYKFFQNFLEAHSNLVQVIFILNDDDFIYINHNLWIWEYASKNGIPLISINQKFEWKNQSNQPWFWVNFDFINIYGGNEYNRTNNKSEIYKLLNLDEINVVIEQHRIENLIHINDVLKILLWTIENRESSKSGNYKLSLQDENYKFIEDLVSTFKNKNIQIKENDRVSDNDSKDFFNLGYQHDLIDLKNYYKHKVDNLQYP